MIKEDLMFSHLGNGITVFDRNREKNNDYLIVAHIDRNRFIDFQATLTERSRRKIINYASYERPKVSASQDDIEVFSVPPCTDQIRNEILSYVSDNRLSGGVSEFDKRINDLNREYVRSYKREKLRCYLVKFHEKTNPIVEYNHEYLENFSFDAVIPRNDKLLADHIKRFNSDESGHWIAIDDIQARIKELKGETFLWA